MLDEAERSLHDALCVLSQTVTDSRVLLGGGWPEMVMAKDVDELARKTPGKKSLAMEAFSRALQAIPTIIADNAGLDSAELIAQLRAEHHKERSTAGIDVISGAVSAKQFASTLQFKRVFAWTFVVYRHLLVFCFLVLFVSGGRYGEAGHIRGI